MDRLVAWRCSNCGKTFNSKTDCKNHEIKCSDRYYLAKNHKNRLKNYVLYLVSQGFDVSVDTFHTTILVSVVDVKKLRRFKN